LARAEETVWRGAAVGVDLLEEMPPVLGAMGGCDQWARAVLHTGGAGGDWRPVLKREASLGTCGGKGAPVRNPAGMACHGAAARDSCGVCEGR
jgi:hypothetical protein